MTKIIIKCEHGNLCRRTDGKEIYPHRKDLYHKIFYKSDSCNCYGGTHANGLPLGIPCSVETRKARIMAHTVFDALWKSGKISRSQAYKRLSKDLEIEPKDCHIGMFDKDRCLKVLKILNNWS
ncbi:MAG: zinc-finger-containing protein [Rickettsia sp.]